MKKKLLLFITLAVIGMAGAGYTMPKEVCAEETSPTATPAVEEIGGAYSTEEYNGVTYAYHTDVINGKVYATDVHISGMTIEDDISFPKDINGYPIYSLGRDVMENGAPVSTKNNFFYNCKMMNYVKLDFSACTELQKINPYAFSKESYIIIIIMPETLREVGENAFMACSRAVVDASKVLDVVFDGTKDEDCSLEWVSYYNTDAKRYFGSQNVTVAMAVGKVRFEYNADYPVYPLNLVATLDSNKKARIRYGSTPMNDVVENTYHYNKTNVYADPNQSAASLQGSRVIPPTSKYEDFDGYYTIDGIRVIDENGLFIPETKAELKTEGNTLYARYTPHKFTITYDVNCPEEELEVNIPSTTRTFDFGASRNDLFGGINIPQRKGYKFSGWMLSTKKGLYYAGLIDMTYIFCQDTEEEMNATVQAVWTPDNLDITIHANRYEGDTESHTGKAAYDENVGMSIDKDTWNAWSESMKGSYIVGYALSPNGEVLENSSMYANDGASEYWIIWKKDYYKFGLHSTETSEHRIISVNRDETFTFTDDLMKRPGYHISSFTFRYDEKEEDGTVVQKTVEKEVGTVIKDACPEYKYYGGHFALWGEVYVNWEPDTYTVKFDVNSDDVTGKISSQTVTFGKSFKLPEESDTFYRKGYTFLGWTTQPRKDLVSEKHAAFWEYYDENGEPIYHERQGLITEPTEGKTVTYYAHWMKKFTHVSYRLVDENRKYIGLKEMLDLKKCTTIHEFGKEEKLPTVEKDNYRFLGWKNEKTGAIYTDKIPKDIDYDLMLVPQFKQYDYKVLPGKNVEKVWFPESALRTAENLGPGDEIGWTHVKIKDPVHYVGSEIEFVNNSTGEVIFKDELSYQDGEDIRLPDDCFIKMPESDVTVNITYKPKTYFVYLEREPGIAADGKSVYFTYGQENEIPVLKKKGYVLKEWIVKQGPEDMVGKAIKKFDKDFWYTDRQIILSPVWEHGTYTLTFDPNGGKVDTTSVSFTNGTKSDFVFPIPEREEYSFVEWIDEDGKAWDTIDVTREDYTLIAKWEKNGENAVTDYSLDKENDADMQTSLAYKELQGENGYYYNQLTEVEKLVYATLYAKYKPYYEYDVIPMGTCQISSSVEVTPENVKNAGYVLAREHVDLFWIRYFITSTSWRGEDGKYYIQVKPQASYAKSSYTADAHAYSNNLKKVLSELPADGDDYTKVKNIYEYIAKNYSYRNNTKILGATTTNETRSVGYMLARHEGCCESYAKLTKLLCDKLGVECIIVNGCNHMWNQVKIDGKWYIVDSTWGDSGDEADDWFLLIGSDSVHDENHRVENNAFCNYDEDGNRIAITEYACMPAPAVEKTDYVYPGNSVQSVETKTETKIETNSTTSDTKDDSAVAKTTEPKNDTVKTKVIRKTVKKGKKITIKTGKWKIKNKKIVSISKKKIVKGLKKGKTTITGKIKGVSYRYIITVK